MEKCELHAVYNQNCIDCLISKVNTLESDLERINTLAHKANQSLKDNPFFEMEVIQSNYIGKLSPQNFMTNIP